jgi:DNA-binding CsgD family transcriptional regulator
MNLKCIAQEKETLQYNRQSHDSMVDLCKPLKDCFNIDWFVRSTLLLNSNDECISVQTLVTDHKYLEIVLFNPDNNEIHFTQAIKATPVNSHSYFLFQNGEGCPFRKMLCQGLSIAKGLVIYERYENRIESCGFASSALGQIPYAITEDSIKNFIAFKQYFEEKKLLKAMSPPFVEYNAPFDMSYRGCEVSTLEKFKSSIESKSFTLNFKGQSFFLSKREWECLSQLARGKTYKEIANFFAISSRTVETHLNNIKDKTGFSYRSDLIAIFHENNSSSCL